MFKAENLRDYLDMRISIISLLKIPIKRRLKKKEKQFYIECIILNMQGESLSSIDSLNKLRDLMGFRNTDNVYTYRSNLKKTKWFYRNQIGEFKLLPMFDFSNKPLNTSIDYTFTIGYSPEVAKEGAE